MTSGLPDGLGTDIAEHERAPSRPGELSSSAGTRPRRTRSSKLRADFPTSDSAVYSYIVEANRFAQQDKVIDAQRLLTKLADDFPTSPYAPYALYQAALQAERLGTDANLQGGRQVPWRASSRSIPAATRSSPRGCARATCFASSTSSRRPSASMSPSSTIPRPRRTMPTQDQNTILAQLALAECHNAQSADSPTHSDSAQRMFQDLVDRMDAPVDVRIEAGYNLGVILARDEPRQGAGRLVERRRGRIPREAGRPAGPRAEGPMVGGAHAAGCRRPLRAAGPY